LTLAQRLAEALAEASAALEAGDPVAAAPPAERAARICEEARASGARLDTEEIGAVGRAHARAARAAGSERERLAGALGRASSARRAADAYRP
jgi:hypothetical protein